jgi:hypothetical protein
MQEMDLKLSLVELYHLLGDNKGISFYYDELPGIVVTIGFTKEEEIENEPERTDLH